MNVEKEKAMSRGQRYALAVLLSLTTGAVVSGCISLKTKHTIDPIHITMDVNLKVQKELEDFLNLDN